MMIPTFCMPLFVATLGLFAMTIIVLGSDVVVGLRTGVWQSVKLQLAWDRYLHGTQLDLWLHAPRDWYGLHKLTKDALDGPLWLGLFVAGTAMAFCFVGVFTAMEKAATSTFRALERRLVSEKRS